MKYMTFNNSCFFAAIANILEKSRINVEDKDIVRNSLIPFIFKKDKDTNIYRAGYDIQNDELISEYLNRYGLMFLSKKFTHEDNVENKKNLIEDIKDKKYVIVSLKVLENQNRWHATIFARYKEPHFIFKNMKKKDSKETDYYMFTKEELLDKLADVVQYGFITNRLSNTSVNKQILLSNSLTVLNDYKLELFKYCNELHSHKDRLYKRDVLFRALFLNYLDLSRLLNYSQIESKLEVLQKQYLDSFKNVYEIKISSYLDMDLLEEVFNDIITNILNKMENNI